MPENNKDNNFTNSWTNNDDSILDILNNIRINSIMLSHQHQKQYNFYKNLLLFFRIPQIVLSASNSFVAVAAQSFLPQRDISLINAVISLFCSILTSIELLLNVQKKMEIELSSEKDYYKLGVEIYKVINIDKDRRMVDSKTFLDEKFSEYVKLIQNSNPIIYYNTNFIDKLAPLPEETKTNFIDLNFFTKYIKDLSPSNLFPSNISNLSNKFKKIEIIKNNDEIDIDDDLNIKKSYYKNSNNLEKNDYSENNLIKKNLIKNLNNNIDNSIHNNNIHNNDIIIDINNENNIDNNYKDNITL
jgi:hypothetical protein